MMSKSRKRTAKAKTFVDSAFLCLKFCWEKGVNLGDKYCIKSVFYEIAYLLKNYNLYLLL